MGHSSNELTIGTTSGDFDTSRWLVKGNVSGNWQYRRWRVIPFANLAYITENQHDFFNSVGTYISGQSISLGRLQFGPELGYNIIDKDNLMVEPFAGIIGVWDFHNPNVATIDGVVVGLGNFWGRLEGGFVIRFGKGTMLRGLVSWDGIGVSDYSGYTLQCTLSIPLY